ncbi:hypothetical protein ZIOFF_044572 [Zingiber officinale]|uniref:Myb/SANT-like domain-containing protein n=1 Tax=Zingiber officinale TaxID=94328 RepID=A0A8J5G1D4_ZINOF|nr:hypothetical protein ZIOFF_044572 [Zingiber officinale]
MVDAAMRGWRDTNGVLNKRTVEIKILPTLNAKLGCEKTFAQYQSRLKWFKQRYNNYCKLMRHSSGFGWDSMTKKFTASDEVWEDYFKSHPKHEHYRTDTFEDYEDLRLVVGNGTATGKYAIGLGDDIDARTFETEENGESSYQPLFSEDLASPLPSQPMSFEVPQATRKRDRSEFEAKSSTSKNIDPNVLNRLSYTIEKASSKIELVDVADDNCWDAIKQVPNLDNPLKSIAVDMMVKPGSAMPEKIRESTRFYPYFKVTIDGTHIPAMVSGQDINSYRNRHGEISQNVLAACNLDLEFIYVLSGWEGSAHDSLVLTDALSRNNGLKVPGEFTGQGRHPENAKELFNLRHASLRNAIERIFGSVILMNFQSN